jgi:ribonuclease G
MLKEIVVNSTPNEIRIGIVEDRELVELLSESADATRMVGNLYKGKVTAVRPGLQAAFVDIGFDKAGFLHVSDLVHEEPDDDDDDRSSRRRGRSREGMRPIERMLREGDQILVQVVKEPIGTKGPRLTADVSLPGRFLVLMPKGSHVGVSRKIADRKERGRLKEMLSAVRPTEGAYIIRTAGEGIDEKMLRRDVEYLADAWTGIKQRMSEVTAPAVVHEDVGLIVGLIRDVLTEDVDAVHIDNEQDYNRLAGYVKNFAPQLLDRIKLYRGDMALFDKFDIESELKKSLERKVWMKKGGYIVVDPTEALVAIDVNTGRFTGKRNQEETIFKTNMIAAREVPRQLRLRDIGGIIIIDFIDMESEANKRKVLNELRTYLKRDRARTKTFNVSDLGLVEMSRQRVRESLQARLSDDCPFCRATGHILSLDTLANKVERLLSKCGLVTQEGAIQVQASPSLAIHLLTHRSDAVEKIARSFNMKIDILDDARIHREEFKIVSLRNRKDLTSQLETAVWKGTATRRRSSAAAAGSHTNGNREHSADEEGEDSRSVRSRRGSSTRGSQRDGGNDEDRQSGRSRRSRSSSQGRGRPRTEDQGRSSTHSSEERGRPRREAPPRGSSSAQESERQERQPANGSSQTARPAAGETRAQTPGDEGGTHNRTRRRRRGRRGRGRGKGAAKTSGETASTTASTEAKSTSSPSLSKESSSPPTNTQREDRPRRSQDSRSRNRSPRQEERPRTAETRPREERPRSPEARSHEEQGSAKEHTSSNATPENSRQGSAAPQTPSRRSRSRRGRGGRSRHGDEQQSRRDERPAHGGDGSSSSADASRASGANDSPNRATQPEKPARAPRDGARGASQEEQTSNDQSKDGETTKKRRHRRTRRAVKGR